ncbi:Uncharacterised protein [Segatella copri]|nr:Uncharacterised protein [Segatella copri]
MEFSIFLVAQPEELIQCILQLITLRIGQRLKLWRIVAQMTDERA